MIGEWCPHTMLDAPSVMIKASIYLKDRFAEYDPDRLRFFPKNGWVKVVGKFINPPLFWMMGQGWRVPYSDIEITGMAFCMLDRDEQELDFWDLTSHTHYVIPIGDIARTTESLTGSSGFTLLDLLKYEGDEQKQMKLVARRRRLREFVKEMIPVLTHLFPMPFEDAEEVLNKFIEVYDGDPILDYPSYKDETVLRKLVSFYNKTLKGTA